MDTKKDSANITDAHKQVYDSVAEEYEQRAQARSNSSKQRVERFVGFVTTGKTVLELGCAVGQELQNFNALGFTSTGIELSPRMVVYAKRRNPTSEVITGDFASIEFVQRYDAVYAQAFIHLFPKDEAVRLMQKVFTLLKPGGVAFFGTTKAKKSEEGWIEKTDYADNPGRYRRFWTKAELEHALTGVGFKIIDYYEELGLENKDRMNITVRRD